MTKTDQASITVDKGTIKNPPNRTQINGLHFKSQRGTSVDVLV